MTKLLLTNDDGIDAPGLAALGTAAAGLGQAVIIAPLETHSGCSHRVTTSGPIRIKERGPERFAVEGTPADCVRLGLHLIAPLVDWVLAGVNEGGNLGADVHHSGTVAAVREAVLHGRPGIALSHYRKGKLPIDWDRAVRWIRPLLHELLDQTWSPGSFWNINLPHLEAGDPDPAIVYCPVDSGPLPLSFRQEGDWLHYDGDYHQRPRIKGSDVDVCFSGKIAVSRIILH